MVLSQVTRCCGKYVKSALDPVQNAADRTPQEPEALGQAQKLYFEHKAGPLTIGGMREYFPCPTARPRVY